MTKYLADAVLDAPADYLIANGTELYLCSSQPADRADAIAKAITAVHALTAGSYAKADDSSGRKVTVAAQSGLALTGNGNANSCYVAICSTTALLVADSSASSALSSGNTVSIGAFKINFPDPT